VRRGRGGVGVPVDAARIREARIEAGLSLGQLAGTDVSRTMIHLVEHGRSRPSRRVLELIARRTRKPISYFLLSATAPTESSTDFVDELRRIANRIQKFARANRLTTVEREAMKLIEVTLHQSADLAWSVQANHMNSEDTDTTSGAS
jgi:transcriptional regulator with XRE-family HTH domain